MPKTIKPQSQIRKIKAELARVTKRAERAEMLLARKTSALLTIENVGVRATFAGKVRVDPELFASSINTPTAKSIHLQICCSHDLSATPEEKALYDQYARDWIAKLDRTTSSQQAGEQFAKIGA